MRTFVIGDIHGTHKALGQCLERSGFDRSSDRLIVLGDVADRYPQVRECFDELLKIRNLDYIIGNHDLWLLDWALKGIKESVWLKQGGLETIASYGTGPFPLEHLKVLQQAHYYLELDGQLFIHGGYNPEKPIGTQDRSLFPWDRQLVKVAHHVHAVRPDYSLGVYQEIFVGHTPTTLYNSLEPLKVCNVWMLDTAAGWEGKLTIMDVQTKEFWQSDPVTVLYPKGA